MGNSLTSTRSTKASHQVLHRTNHNADPLFPQKGGVCLLVFVVHLFCPELHAPSASERMKATVVVDAIRCCVKKPVRVAIGKQAELQRAQRPNKVAPEQTHRPNRSTGFRFGMAGSTEHMCTTATKPPRGSEWFVPT